MKREIKFRVWDIEKKCFIPNHAWALLVNNQSFGVMMIDWENYREGEYFYDNAQILMQFTGLQDINGKDIYEGDILCVPHLEGTRHKVRMVIEWNNDNAEFTKYNPKNAFEIIGNIYENPELLKTTENE
jgi:uncharacterized phage protein (TIGR01671 family)